MQQNSHQGCIYKWQIAEAELEGAVESALCDSCGWLGMVWDRRQKRWIQVEKKWPRPNREIQGSFST